MKKQFRIDLETLNQLKYVQRILKLDSLDEALELVAEIGATMTAIHSRVAEAKFKELLEVVREERILARLEKAWGENTKKNEGGREE